MAFIAVAQPLREEALRCAGAKTLSRLEWKVRLLDEAKLVNSLGNLLDEPAKAQNSEWVLAGGGGN